MVTFVEVCFLQQVAGIPMAIMKSSVVYKYRWMVFLVNAAAACPAGELLTMMTSCWQGSGYSLAEGAASS